MTLASRNGLDLLARVSRSRRDLPTAFESVPIVVDGEIVSLDADGRSSASNDCRRRRRNVRRADLRRVRPALRRRARSAKDCRSKSARRCSSARFADDGIVLYSKHVVGAGTTFFAVAQRKTLEGIVGKRRDSTYQERRSRDWLKIKAQLRARVRRRRLDRAARQPQRVRRAAARALRGRLAALRRTRRHRVFAESCLRELHARLEKLARKTSPFDAPLEDRTAPHWVKPELVVEVRFTEWTRDGLLAASGVPRAAPRQRRPERRLASVPQHRPSAMSAAERVAVTVGARRLSLSNLDKVLWPRDGYTKGDLIEYYRGVADGHSAVPAKTGRSRLQRYPDGIDGPSFFEKHLPKGVAGLGRARDDHGVAEGGKKVTYIVCNDEADARLRRKPRVDSAARVDVARQDARRAGLRLLRPRSRAKSARSRRSPPSRWRFATRLRRSGCKRW